MGHLRYLLALILLCGCSQPTEDWRAGKPTDAELSQIDNGWVDSDGTLRR